LCGQRHGEDEVERVDWDLARAKNAGLGTGDNWKKYPRAMLLARATSELCRLKFADIVGGLSYTPDELEEFEPVQVAPAASRRRAAPEPVAELAPVVEDVQSRGALTHTRPRETDVVVDTPELPPSTGTRKRKPPTAPAVETPALSDPVVLASEEDRDAIATILKQFQGDNAARADLMARWAEAGIGSFRAVERFTHDDAQKALELLADFQIEQQNAQPTRDGAA
jgi:hypothetical protein